ncbi:MAG: 4-hydroxy-tetrahydrodipicolinate reductase [Deltaproteobacteria bacterium]|nr:4-hydroxy-tetrahydrodipicolinate reductase [Deltaproteobacteria bacterium]
MSLPLAVSGALGRMGRAVVRLAAEAQDLAVVTAWEVADHPALGQPHPDLAGLHTGPAGSGDPARVVVDFSSPAGARQALEISAARGMAFVCGTTGLDGDFQLCAREAARRIPVLLAPNMSAGVALLRGLVRRLLELLENDPAWDLELVETHHAAKADAPSGTALQLLAPILASRPGAAVFGREGRPGPRAPGEVGVHALRGGDVVGEHSLHVLGHGERLELVHRAWSRDVFARGALAAARWCDGRCAGLYTLDDVLSGRESHGSLRAP